MPTKRQFWQLHDSGFRDDDRIGHGGYEAPNGRQWWEPERRPMIPDVSNLKSIGYLLFDFKNGTERFIRTSMLEDTTEADDQDWQDFIRINTPDPQPSDLISF